MTRFKNKQLCYGTLDNDLQNQSSLNSNDYADYSDAVTKSRYSHHVGTFIFVCTAILIGSVAIGRHIMFTSDSQQNDTEPHNESLARRPNFVFILSDDVGWNSVGSDSSDLAFATPHLTELAQNGIRLSNYYSQELCSPARASLLTGRYPLSVGMQYGTVQVAAKFGLSLAETLLPEVLRDHGGYKNYMLGKWNLGHYCPQMLPTARGFDQFLGFLDGSTYYWSKRNPSSDKFYDIMQADASCYELYSGADLGDYSTNLYARKAVAAIKAHDYTSNPMFMYFAAQAVHDPFVDDSSEKVSDGSLAYGHPDGLEAAEVGDEGYRAVLDGVVGGKRQQYAMALLILDRAVGDIRDALSDAGQLDNSFLIFTSDNGGCYSAGGKNGPLRGTKGSLWEGTPSFCALHCLS